MQKLQERIMTASFGRLLKRWAIAALCLALLGGGTVRYERAAAGRAGGAPGLGKLHPGFPS